MRSGALRHYVSIEYPVVVRDSDGGEIITWTLLANVWASITAGNASEKFGADQVYSEANYIIVIRPLTGVTPKMRINADGDIYQIEGVVDKAGRNKDLNLVCVRHA